VRRRAEEQRALLLPYTAWGRQAELAAEYLAKGRQVYVEGRLRREEYTDREGVQRTSLEVNASDIQFLGQRADTADRGAEKTKDGGQVDDEREEEVGSKSTPSGSGKKQGAKRTSGKEAAGAEELGIVEDGIPF